MHLLATPYSLRRIRSFELVFIRRYAWKGDSQPVDFCASSILVTLPRYAKRAKMKPFNLKRKYFLNIYKDKAYKTPFNANQQTTWDG